MRNSPSWVTSMLIVRLAEGAGSAINVNSADSPSSMEDESRLIVMVGGISVVTVTGVDQSPHSAAQVEPFPKACTLKVCSVPASTMKDFPVAVTSKVSVLPPKRSSTFSTLYFVAPINLSQVTAMSLCPRTRASRPVGAFGEQRTPVELMATPFCGTCSSVRLCDGCRRLRDDGPRVRFHQLDSAFAGGAGGEGYTCRRRSEGDGTALG